MTDDGVICGVGGPLLLTLFGYKLPILGGSYMVMVTVIFPGNLSYIAI